MKMYLSFFRMRFLTLIQYRTAALAGIATQFVFGMMYVLVRCAFFASSDAAQPMDLSQVITYTWLGQAMLGLLPWSVDKEITDSVLTGKVAYELTRPLDLYTMWFMRTLAFRTAPTLLKSVPQFVISTLLVPKQYAMSAPGLWGFAAWLAAIAGAVVLSTAITNFMQATVMFTVRSEGIMRFMPTFVTFMSGMIVPLKFFPDWIQAFMQYQPFAGIMDLPSQLFCGSLAPSAILWVLPMQIIWSLIFIIFGRMLMNRGIRRVAIAGG
jgi:ABC-2 type transport system permease protein